MFFLKCVSILDEKNIYNINMPNQIKNILFETSGQEVVLQLVNVKP